MSATTNVTMIRRELSEDGICQLIFDRPNSGANIFDAGTMSALDAQLDEIETEGEKVKGVIVLSSKKSIFIAGADLQTLLRQAQTGEMRGFIAEGQRVFNRLAGLKVPTCAAIHGACAGGGYEITLACDYRVASDAPATRIGLPETTLGLVPAWGGATRLPRLIGPEKAAEVILKGKLYPAAEAKQLGLVDEVVPVEQLLDAARRKLNDGKRKPEERTVTSTASHHARSATALQAGELRPPTVPGNEAPARAHRIITEGLSRPVDEALKMEVDAITELGQSESTQNLIRNFFLAEKYKKGTSRSTYEPVKHAAVIGAGVMGSGIAQWLSARGVAVILRDVGKEQLERGLNNVDKTYAEAVKRGIMTEEKAREGRGRIVASSAIREMRGVEVVIEAASEKLSIKKEIFRELSGEVSEHAILATNTSALPIRELAGSTNMPERVIGLHFFNPVSRMKLVEVVVGQETASETTERALAFTRQIGKLPVVVQDSPGFLVNRVLFPYLLDAAELFGSGIDVRQIDEALVNWGMPMGPLRLIDEIGVDVTVDIASTLGKAFGERDRAPAILQKMQDEKLLGRKTGAGFYIFEGKSQTPNEKVEQWRRRGGERRSMSADDISLRLVYLMVNEAAHCLQERVVATAEDADYGMILGTGFAPYRGGPLRFADYFGIAEMVSAGERFGGKFQPCELLRKHARDGTKFYQ